jgi:hypothetical protein
LSVQAVRDFFYLIIACIVLVGLLFLMSIEDVDAKGFQKLPGYVDCEAIGPDLVNFTVTPEYPAWYDGGVTITIGRSAKALLLHADRPVSLIVLGDRRMRLETRERQDFRLRLPGDTIRSVLVCYR